jgi:hypothetical protein
MVLSFSNLLTIAKSVIEKPVLVRNGLAAFLLSIEPNKYLLGYVIPSVSDILEWVVYVNIFFCKPFPLIDAHYNPLTVS